MNLQSLASFSISPQFESKNGRLRTDGQAQNYLTTRKKGKLPKCDCPARPASERVRATCISSVLLFGRHGSKSISTAMLCTYCGIRVGLSPENRVNIVTTSSSSSQQDFQQTRFSIGRNFSLTPRHRCPSVCLAEFSRLYFRRIPSSQPRPAIPVHRPAAVGGRERPPRCHSVG